MHLTESGVINHTIRARRDSGENALQNKALTLYNPGTTNVGDTYTDKG